MRIVMMGTGAFAVPTFLSLLDSNHDVAALVSRPPRPVRGRRPAPINPMREQAEQRNMPVLMPEDINAEQARAELTALAADLFVVCDYGQILAHDTLAAARLGGVNLHASLLPRYRGAAPINWAIFHGETETGVTVIHLTTKLDAGPCLVQLKTPIGPEETAIQLEERLAKLGVPPVLEAIELLAASGPDAEPPGSPQNPAMVSKAPRLKKTDGQVDWTRSAIQIHNQVRAMKPWPGTYTYCRLSGGEPLRILLDCVSVAAEEPASAEAAAVLPADSHRLLVATGQGALWLERVQPAGKRVMRADEFLRGYPLRPGDRFGG